MPPLTEQLHRVVLAGRQRALYESVRLAADERVRRVLARQRFDGAMVSILDALLKLRQVCDDPRLLDESIAIGPAGDTSAKLAWLRDTLPSLVAEGRRVLLFSQFTRMLALVAVELDALGLPWLRLTGDTPTGERGATVARIDEDGSGVVCIHVRRDKQVLEVAFARALPGERLDYPNDSYAGAAVDFNNDGWTDLMVFAKGDDPGRDTAEFVKVPRPPRPRQLPGGVPPPPPAC